MLGKDWYSWIIYWGPFYFIFLYGSPSSPSKIQSSKFRKFHSAYERICICVCMCMCIYITFSPPRPTIRSRIHSHSLSRRRRIIVIVVVVVVSPLQFFVSKVLMSTEFQVVLRMI